MITTHHFSSLLDNTNRRLSVPRMSLSKSGTSYVFLIEDVCYRGEGLWADGWWDFMPHSMSYYQVLVLNASLGSSHYAVVR